MNFLTRRIRFFGKYGNKDDLGKFDKDPEVDFEKSAKASKSRSSMKSKGSSRGPTLKFKRDKNRPDIQHLQSPMILVLAGYVNYIFLFVVSFIREFIFGSGPIGGNRSVVEENNREGYAPLFSSFEKFYIRNVYRRMKNVVNHPIASVPGATVEIIKRESNDNFWTMKMVESDTKKYINLGSYNYLGFAENAGPCTDSAIEACKTFGLGTCSTRHEMGTLSLHRELESTVAEFLGVEDAMAFGMGFGTNSLNLPRLIKKGCLVLSDELNHASLILGLRLSGATIKVFKHNDVLGLEMLLRNSILMGNPRTRRPWKKIFIVVEGIYSMEGTIVPLPAIVALKKKYKAYLYVDEAHSVGAMGPRGRGVVDYFNLDPRDIDILMGTFTKSFGSSGGYIAGSKQLINHLRINSQASCYATSVSPPTATQIITAMRSIMNGDGIERVNTLARNSKYFRKRLVQMGFVVYGHDDSPVVPLMVFMVTKIPAFIIGLLDRNVATVGVGFPATKMTQERARFCVSAGHTKEMLDQALSVIDQVGDIAHVKYNKGKNKSLENEIIEY